MKTRSLASFNVSAIGLGCMNLSHAYGTPPPAEQAERLLLAALDAGVTLFDTAALYGFGANETLVGRVMKPHRQRFTLASKGGLGGVKGEDGVVRRVIDGRPESLIRNCEDSLQRLGLAHLADDPRLATARPLTSAWDTSQAMAGFRIRDLADPTRAKGLPWPWVSSQHRLPAQYRLPAGDTPRVNPGGP